MADLGDLVPLTVEIRDTSGSLANAGVVVLTVTLPDGTTATPAVSNPSVGRYQSDFATTMVGRHVARWVATGLNSSAYVDTFDVRPADPGSILSLTDAKRALNIDMADTSNDEEIRSLIEAVTGLVESYRSEVIARRTITEQFSVGPMWRFRTERSDSRYSAAYKLILSRRPVLSVTSIVRPLDGVTWSGAAISLVDAATGVVLSNLDPFWGDLTATYIAGYAVIPANIIEGAKIILRHLWQVQQTPGMSGSVFGTTDDTASVTGAGYAIPNRAAELLGGQPATIA